MTTPLPELVIFDMAGTTIEAGDLVPAAFRAAFQAERIELTGDEISAVRGRSKQDAIAELLCLHTGKAPSRRRVEVVFSRFRQSLMEEYRNQGVMVIAGAEDTFNWLRSRGIKTALVTGFDRQLARLLVELAGWAEMPHALVSNDDVTHGRPAPDLVLEAMRRTGCKDPGRVAVVGDTVSDLRSAHSAGAAWVIGVLSGAHSRSQLEREPHSALIDSVGDLPGLLLSN